eukprot:3089624-Rhodomonas_salina.2
MQLPTGFDLLACAENENELMSWDMIDIGENWTTLGGHQYISIFIIHSSHITILHKTHEDFPSILKHTFTNACFTPKTIRCDGACEYICQKTLQFFADNNIPLQFSNQLEQFGNGMSEKFVDTLGKGICTLLLQSNCPPEFWGAAVHYYTNAFLMPLNAVQGKRHSGAPQACSAQLTGSYDWAWSKML